MKLKDSLGVFLGMGIILTLVVTDLVCGLLDVQNPLLTGGETPPSDFSPSESESYYSNLQK